MSKKYNFSLKLSVDAGNKTEDIQKKVKKVFSIIFSNAFYNVKNTVKIFVDENLSYTLISVSKKEQLSKDKQKNKNFEDFLLSITKDLNRSLNYFDARMFTLAKLSLVGEDNENYFSSYDIKRKMEKMGDYIEHFEEAFSKIINVGSSIESGEKIKKKDLPFHIDFIMDLYYLSSEGGLGFIFIGNKIMLFDMQMENKMSGFYYISPNLSPFQAGVLFLKKLYEDWKCLY